MKYDHLADNAQFLSKIGLLALVDTRGPLRAYPLSERINNVKVIDVPADVKPGDFAYNGYLWGKVTGNVLASGVRTITVKYGPVDKPAGVTAEEWADEYDTLAFEEKKYVTSQEEDTDATGDAHHNPYDRIASIGVVFARKTGDGEITLLNPPVKLGQSTTGFIINVEQSGVETQLYINDEPSGAPVNSPVGGTIVFDELDFSLNDTIKISFAKPGYESRTVGPFKVEGSGLDIVALYSTATSAVTPDSTSFVISDAHDYAHVKFDAGITSWKVYDKADPDTFEGQTGISEASAVREYTFANGKFVEDTELMVELTNSNGKFLYGPYTVVE